MTRQFETATFIGYSYDASYYINNDVSGYDNPDGDEHRKNADAVLEQMRSDYGPSARIVDCGQDTFFGRPDYGSHIKGDCVEYTIFYNPGEVQQLC